MKLVVPELVTNAIVHADGCATVGLYYNGGRPPPPGRSRRKLH
ncbi:hypothetical protein ACFH04_11835 [Streptomyces noboritoensis]|uniref:ATP-binding protein n=1 Tax=Streptomyces noboritoensis TaxID=67337 RepID=A0ABV6TG58_9ACTN